MTALPIDDALPGLLAALDSSNTAVLVAPPGAGKTTRVPLALLDAAWRGEGKIMVLEPRRLAARGAAQRMAETLGERLGQTVGLRARMDVAVSTATRIEVVTQGVFTRMVLDDPALEGVATVLFDEFHERGLDADLGLALARDVQAALREDLRLLVMSATLDAAGIADLLGAAPVITSEGRAYPVETHYLGRPRPERGERPETAVARAVARALGEGDGDVLVFLPGQAEIARVMETLRGIEADVVALHGGLDRQAQDRAVRPGDGRRVVVASAIAESSLTIPGVRAVVDVGLARRPRFDPGSGITRLETHRASRASVDQRRGRAGRLGPGRCYRLWSEPETRALPAFEPPEILNADLTPLALALAEWGVADPADLLWLDPPPAGPLAEARGLLARIGALARMGDGAPRLTEHGQRLARLPLLPRLGTMLLRAPARHAKLAARIAVILSERGLGGGSLDLDARLAAWGRDRSPRTRQSEEMAQRWARLVEGLADDPSVRDAEWPWADAAPTATLVALAYPERIALRRPGSTTLERKPRRGGPERIDYVTVEGRGAWLNADAPLARSEGLAVAELTGAGASARIALAAAMPRDAIEAWGRHGMETRLETTFDEAAEAVRTRRVRSLGAIVLDSAPASVPPGAGAAALVARAREIGVARLPWSDAARRLRARIAFVRSSLDDGVLETWPDVSDEALSATLEDWLLPFLADDATRWDDITGTRVHDALAVRLTYPQTQTLDREAPARLPLRAARVPVDYTVEGPAVAARAQAFYGLDTHPTLAGRPVLVTLLSPARRPIQTTRDLPGFWRGSWMQVRTEMRARYIKHDWPERPWEARASDRV